MRGSEAVNNFERGMQNKGNYKRRVIVRGRFKKEKLFLILVKRLMDFGGWVVMMDDGGIEEMRRKGGFFLFRGRGGTGDYRLENICNYTNLPIY